MSAALFFFLQRTKVSHRMACLRTIPKPTNGPRSPTRLACMPPAGQLRTLSSASASSVVWRGARGAVRRWKCWGRRRKGPKDSSLSLLRTRETPAADPWLLSSGHAKCGCNPCVKRHVFAQEEVGLHPSSPVPCFLDFSYRFRYPQHGKMWFAFLSLQSFCSLDCEPLFGLISSVCNQGILQDQIGFDFLFMLSLRCLGHWLIGFVKIVVANLTAFSTWLFSRPQSQIFCLAFDFRRSSRCADQHVPFVQFMIVFSHLTFHFAAPNSTVCLIDVGRMRWSFCELKAIRPFHSKHFGWKYAHSSAFDLAAITHRPFCCKFVSKISYSAWFGMRQCKWY